MIVSQLKVNAACGMDATSGQAEVVSAGITDEAQ